MPAPQLGNLGGLAESGVTIGYSGGDRGADISGVSSAKRPTDGLGGAAAAIRFVWRLNGERKRWRRC